MTMQEIFSEMAAEIRESGLSLAELSRRSGVAIPTIRQWLNGTSRGCNVDSMIRTLNALGCEILIRRRMK